jgi:hypothetical protein
MSASIALPGNTSFVKIRLEEIYDQKCLAAPTPPYDGRRVEFDTTVWYIVTDASDVGVAKKLGVVYSPDIASIGAAAIQNAKIVNGELRFEGAPDFRPRRVYVASKGGFPPTSFHPGAVADAAYSPFVHVQGWPGIINASIVATGDGPYDVTEHTNTADRLIAINTAVKTGTFVLAQGFANDMPVLYLSTEASVALPSALERAIYTQSWRRPAPRVPFRSAWSRADL